MNENQKVVLNYLKDSEDVPFGVFGVIADFFDARVPIPLEVNSAFVRLDSKQEFEVLAEFAKWGLKNERD